MYLIRIFFFLVTVFILLACTEQDELKVVDPVENKVTSEETPFLDGMGSHYRSITTSDPMVQRYFNQGLVMSFAFNHAESVRSFRAAQELDEACAICFWGEALALGPNINVRDNGKAVMADDARVQAYTAIQQAIVLKDSASEKERQMIDALATRYNGDISTDRDPLDLAYVEVMRSLSQAYPIDDDIAALYAESMMSTMPWDYWLDKETPKPLMETVIQVLETVIDRSPEHPLATHLYIHAVEASSTPERAEASADILLNLVPGAGHLVHMPSHIYWRVGRYHDAAQANIKAVAVDEAYIAASKAQGFYSAAYYPHTIHFLWAASSMAGRSQEASEAALKVAAKIAPEMITQFPRVEFFKTIPLLTLINFGEWDAVLTEPKPAEKLMFSNAIWHYARAIAYTRKDNLEAAKIEQAQLVTIRDTHDFAFLDTIGYPASMLLQIADELVNGEILMVAGEYKNAIEHLEEAVAIQDKLPFTEPPFWYYPTRLTLGKALLDVEDAREAEQVYRQNLVHYPHNGWATFGLILSLEAQGKDASEIRERFDIIWKDADVVLSASRF